MKSSLFICLLFFLASVTSYGQASTLDAQDDFFEVMGYPQSVFYPLANDTYPAGSLITFDILGSVDCAEVIWDEVNNELTVTFVSTTLCSFNYSLCDDMGNCDIAQVTIQYSCYPWDYPLEMINLQIEDSSAYSFSLMNPCSDDAEILLDFIPDSIDYVLENGAITFSGEYIGEEFFSYWITEKDTFGCIICGTYYEYNLNFDLSNETYEYHMDDINVYPNPAIHSIKIESNALVSSAYLINLLGQRTSLTDEGNGIYRLPQLSPGKYLIFVESDTRSSVRTLLIL